MLAPDRLTLRALCHIGVTLTLVVVGCGAFSCTPKANPSGAPQFPTLVSDSYQATIELNLVNKNKTSAYEEYLDYEGNRAARIIYKDSQSTKIIFSYNTDEIFLIGDTCQVLNMSSPEATQYLYSAGFSSIPNDGDRKKVFGAASALKLTKTSGLYYGGKSQVRGIHTDKWSKCIPNVMLISYYFNDPTWSMEVNNYITPLRIEVEGVGRNYGSTGTHEFNHVYDFINYQPTITVDSTMFETPLNTVCSGREKTKTLPSLPKRFQYKAESIDPTLGFVQHYSVWYEGDAQLVRIDRRSVERQPPLYSVNPLTEIHDFSTGVRYVKDRDLGNCSVLPLSSTSMDSHVLSHQTLGLADPNNFFYFSDNFAYTGVRTVRGMKCDVFSAIVPNYTMSGETANASFHYFFLSDDWNDFPLQGGMADINKYPVRLEINVAGFVGSTQIFNFFDFDESPMSFDAFDITDCYDNKNRLGFTITFPGKYNPATEDPMKYFTRFTIADKVEISPIRIGDLQVSADLNNIYVSGFFVGTNPAAQFQLATKNVQQRQMDKEFFSTHLPKDCAVSCANNQDFLCQGFLYCPDDGFYCGLNRYHVLNQTVKPQAKSCDFFTRTVPTFDVKEPTLDDAYNKLVDTINNQQFTLNIAGPNNVVTFLEAVGVKKTSGPSKIGRPMPSINSQFSYREEMIIPKNKLITESYVWYDNNLKLVRHDTRKSSENAMPTEYSQIYDFNDGVLYAINKVTNQCQIKPISASDQFDVDRVASKPTKDGGVQIVMKSPLEFFYLDGGTYTFIGQKVVRGILCDGYQTKRSDFYFSQTNSTSESSIFTFYFQAEKWKYVTADSMKITGSQPIQLVIEDLKFDLSLIYNFYDYDDEFHNFNYFDTSLCYNTDEMKKFEIIFKNQPFHPYLDAYEPTFQNTVAVKLGEVTQVSPVRYQRIATNHDDTDLYVTVTMLGNIPAKYLFQSVAKVVVSPSMQQMVVDSMDDCASSCVNLDLDGKPCNSFDFCPGSSQSKCSLLTSDEEFPSSGRIQADGPCTHYSRSEENNLPMYSVQDLLLAITDVVYDNLFQIGLTFNDGTGILYNATGIRDDLLQPNAPSGEAGSMLSEFKVTKRRKLPDAAAVETHPMISVADCALLCLSTTNLECETFDYDFNHGTCRLAAKHLDELTAPLDFDLLHNVYTTSYTRDYTQDGLVFPNNPGRTIYSVESNDICARNCNEAYKFNCEEFEYCPGDKTCYLYEQIHQPVPQPSHAGQMPKCSHFTRHFLLGFTKISNTIIVGQDFTVAETTFGLTEAECARECVHGFGLSTFSCASFEVCQHRLGLTGCTFFRADPTQAKANVTRQNSIGCDLFVKANPTKHFIKPKPPKVVIVNPSCPPIPDTTPCGPSGTSANQNQQSHTSPPDSVHNANQKSPSSSDTGARTGIAFGTLFLGLLLGAAGMFVFNKWYMARKYPSEDTHQLKEYNPPNP